MFRRKSIQYSVVSTVQNLQILLLVPTLATTDCYQASQSVGNAKPWQMQAILAPMEVISEGICIRRQELFIFRVNNSAVYIGRFR